MGAALKLPYAALIVGAAALVEHPTEPEVEVAASCWKLPEVDHLIQLGATRCYLSRSMFGAQGHAHPQYQHVLAATERVFPRPWLL